MFWWLLLLVIGIIVYKLHKPHQYWKEKRIPHVKPWPIVGNMKKTVFRQQSFADWVVDLYNSYDTRYFGIYQFFEPILLLKDIDLIKKITIKDFDHFVDHRLFTSEEAEPIFSKNLFALKGERWRDMRNTLSPAFTSSKMRSMYTLISESAEQFANYFAKIADPNKPLVVEMKDIYTRFANDTIATCAFGVQCDSLEEKNNEFYLMGKDVTNFSSGFKAIKMLFIVAFPWFFGKILKLKVFSEAATNFFKNLVLSTIATREKHGIVRPDMIHLLMEARKGRLKHEGITDADAGFATVEESQVGKEVKQNKPPLTDEDIIAQAFLFFFAGFETTSTLLSFLSYELAVNEDVQRKLQDEIDAALKKHNGKLTYEGILHMKYLDMVVSESLRKWPSVPALDRICVKPYTIEPTDSSEIPLRLEKDDVIMIPVYALHRNPEYFPDPERFDPERFSDENKDKIKPFTYLPFGIGPRNCIGSRFALLETKSLFVNILSKFDIVVVEKTQVPLQLEKKTFNMTSENGYWLGLKLRSK